MLIISTNIFGSFSVSSFDEICTFSMLSKTTSSNSVSKSLRYILRFDSTRQSTLCSDLALPPPLLLLLPLFLSPLLLLFEFVLSFCWFGFFSPSWFECAVLWPPLPLLPLLLLLEFAPSFGWFESFSTRSLLPSSWFCPCWWLFFLFPFFFDFLLLLLLLSAGRCSSFSRSVVTCFYYMLVIACFCICAVFICLLFVVILRWHFTSDFFITISNFKSF